MNNTVYDVDFSRALPYPLRNDNNILALGQAIAVELQENIRLSRQAIIYARLDELDETLLDILAKDLHVDWYDPDSPLDVKRRIIKDSVKVHKLRGTKYAVESVARVYFGSCEVREWYEYGGRPHHFKIISGNPSITEERAAEFLRILDSVKRKSSWLETILITLTGESSLFLGAIFHEKTIEKTVIGSRQTDLQYGFMFYEHTTEKQIIKGELT